MQKGTSYPYMHLRLTSYLSLIWPIQLLLKIFVLTEKVLNQDISLPVHSSIPNTLIFQPISRLQITQTTN